MKKVLIFLLNLVLFLNFSTAPVLAAANVTFDNQGTWIINGEREFIYYINQIPRPAQTATTNEIWERMVNYYHVNSVAAGMSPKADQLAQQYGIYLLIEKPQVKYNDWNNHDTKATILDVASRPNRLFFFASEENTITDDRIFQGYDYLSQTFPKIPSHINFTNMATKYSSQYSDYIRRTKAAVISSHVGDAAANTAIMVRFRDEIPSLKSAFMLFRKDENPQLEKDIFKSIVKGINGIQFWEMYGSGAHYVGEWGETIARVGGYLKEIMPGLVAPNRQYKTDYLIAKGEDNRWYVIATPGTGTLTVTGLPKNTEFERLFYGSGLITTNANGTLSDGGGKIRIYRQKTAAASPSPAGKRGDFNNDGRVDADDYQLLRSGFGTTYNIFHYNQLVQNFDN